MPPTSTPAKFITPDQVTACTGLIILALRVVVAELKNIAQRLGPGPVSYTHLKRTDEAPGSLR